MGNWLAHCQENNIIPAILIPHSSQLTQSFDVDIFGPLKKNIEENQATLANTNISFTKDEMISGFH